MRPLLDADLDRARSLGLALSAVERGTGPAGRPSERAIWDALMHDDESAYERSAPRRLLDAFAHGSLLVRVDLATTSSQPASTAPRSTSPTTPRSHHGHPAVRR